MGKEKLFRETQSVGPRWLDLGWVKLYRELLNKPIWRQSTPEQKSILITIILMADHAPQEWDWRGKRFQTKPGQFITSLESIANEAGKGISIQNVRGSLKRFSKKFDFLTDESTKTGRLITINNWDTYQPKMENPTDDPTDDQQRGNKEVTPNKNERMKEDSLEVPKGTSCSSDGTPPDTPKVPSCPQNVIIETYHRLLPSLKRMIAWDETAKKYLRQRWREAEDRQTIDWWIAFFSYVSGCDFLLGKNNRGWQADLRWLVKPENFAKTLNGNFENKKVEFRPETYHQCVDAERRSMAAQILEARNGKRNNDSRIISIDTNIPVCGQRRG